MAKIAFKKSFSRSERKRLIKQETNLKNKNSPSLQTSAKKKKKTDQPSVAVFPINAPTNEERDTFEQSEGGRTQIKSTSLDTAINSMSDVYNPDLFLLFSQPGHQNGNSFNFFSIQKSEKMS